MQSHLGSSLTVLLHSVLAETHIKSCRTRSPRLYRRLVSSDLQELVSTGMLTVRAKLEETAVREDPQRLVVRIAEVWGFFWGLLPVSLGEQSMWKIEADVLGVDAAGCVSTDFIVG